jgi:hypothetical protein
MWPNGAQTLRRLSALPGVSQDDLAPMIIDDPPLLDFLERTKTADAGVVVVQAAIADTRGLG